MSSHFREIDLIISSEKVKNLGIIDICNIIYKHYIDI